MLSSDPGASASRLHFGAAYYPEHWPVERWPEDIRLMREAGMTVARMAEFAWSTMEPQRGVFELDWLEQAIELLIGSGIVSVLGTPTAAPPAWLVQEHPDLLAVDEHGRRVQFGNRCHYCVTSPELHAATSRVVEAMARRFGASPHVIGWQIDNEYNRVCYCERCRQHFQRWLQQQYGTLDALNQAWSTRYWSQTYSDWSQIPIPIGQHNPGLRLAWQRFVTSSYRAFQRLQIDILRPQLRPGVWITHNFMNWFEPLDHYALSEDLDLVSWDWYVSTGPHDYLSSGAAHDLTRGFKRRNFWLIETQPGNVNWAAVNTTLNRGEARAMAWHAIAHGADAVLYWQWRSALGGQEQYHGTLVDQAGRARPFYEEARQLGRDLQAASPLLAGTQPVAEVALINDYESRWSISWQRHHGDFDYVAHLRHYYRPLAARNLAVDIISADAPLDGYKLVIAPALVLLSDTRVAQLRDFVGRGGQLVLTLRSGMKDSHNALLPMRQPGPLAELAGVEVEDYYALLDPVPVQGEWFAGSARLWAERLRPLDDPRTRVLARYGAANGWLDGQVAISQRSHGLGRVYVVGAYLDDESQDTLIERIVGSAGLTPVLETPAGVEACRRVGPAGRQVYILVNHLRAEQRVRLPWTAREHLSGTMDLSEVLLAPYGVAVLTHEE